jgi:hypothetical protein
MQLRPSRLKLGFESALNSAGLLGEAINAGDNLVDCICCGDGTKHSIIWFVRVSHAFVDALFSDFTTPSIYA